MIPALAAIIAHEKALNLPETMADMLRAAAIRARTEFPECSAANFGDAAATLGYHRQGATNRFREGIKFLEELEAIDEEIKNQHRPA